MSDVDTLKAAGFNLDSLGDEELAAVGNLSSDEIDSLVAIRAKLNGDDEVAGHARAAAGDGIVVW